MPEAFTASRLRRLAQQPHPFGGAGKAGGGQDRCDLCAEPLAPAHRHLLDVPAGSVGCACGACALLFDGQAAGGSHYRLLPERRLRLDRCDIDDALWAGLGVPVDLAFFVRGSATGEVTSGYPSPLGVLRSTVDPPTWDEVAATDPAIAGMADDVEALLVNRAKGAREHWLVPLDDCYRLAAVVRTHWKGLAGGPDVWEHVGRFFTDLPSCAPAVPEPSPRLAPPAHLAHRAHRANQGDTHG